MGDKWTQMSYSRVCFFPARWYKVITETSNINWAGTNSDVFITLVDVNNRYSWEFELDNHYDNFEVGGKAPQDLFEISTNQRLGMSRFSLLLFLS